MSTPVYPATPHPDMPGQPSAPTFPAGTRARIHPQSRVHAPEVVAVAFLLATAALLYIVDIEKSGWGNTYYAAAVQAGAESGKAFLYGASDAPASITVDKPPASLWLMALSVRLLGLSPFAVLLPQALLGVATVALVYLTVRRASTPSTALLAGAVMATTPVAALMFRYNNPDALLTALLALAGYATVRAVERGQLRWVLLVGATFGFAFLTKQLQAFLPYPAFVLCYLVAAPGTLRRRVRNVVVAVVTTIVSAGWWVALVELVPPESRPYIGGSTTNSFLELTLGYNGIGRLVGGSGNGASGIGNIVRTFLGASALGIAWFLPAALILGVTTLNLRRRRPRTDLRRALLISSLAGLIVSDLAFSLMGGIYHSYYCVAMAPMLAVALSLSLEEVWHHRHEPRIRILLAVVAGVTAIWHLVLLAYAPGNFAAATIVVALLGAATVFLLITVMPQGRHNALIATVAVCALLTGPSCLSLATAAVGHSGSSPKAGYTSQQPAAANAEVVALLEQSRGYDWAAATSGSRTAASYQLASGQAVMPIGGYTRKDPSPTLAQFKTWVAQGRIHWYIGKRGEIGHWVATHYKSKRVGKIVLYDLSAKPTD